MKQFFAVLWGENIPEAKSYLKYNSQCTSIEHIATQSNHYDGRLYNYLFQCSGDMEDIHTLSQLKDVHIFI